jgi:foldase protein PrsA
VTRPLPRSLLFGLFALALAAAACDADGGPAASVGDAEITHEELQTDVASFRFLSGLSGAPCGSRAPGESAAVACTRFTLTNEIQEEIVKAYAQEHDVAVDPADVTTAIGQLETNLGGPAELDARLEADGLTRQALTALAHRLLLFNEVQSAVVAERLDDDDLMARYQELVPQFTTVEVHHILLPTEARAEEIAAEATPENFARLARSSSVDQGSAPNGGNLGSYSESQFRAQFDPIFVETALALPVGGISGVVQTQFGFHLIRLVQRDVATFEQVREQLAAQEGPLVFDEWLQERYDTLEIEVNPRYGRLDAESGQVVAIRSTAEDLTGPTGETGIGGATAPTGTTAGP